MLCWCRHWRNDDRVCVFIKCVTPDCECAYWSIELCVKLFKWAHAVMKYFLNLMSLFFTWQTWTVCTTSWRPPPASPLALFHWGCSVHNHFTADCTGDVMSHRGNNMQLFFTCAWLVVARPRLSHPLMFKRFETFLQGFVLLSFPFWSVDKLLVND